MDWFDSLVLGLLAFCAYLAYANNMRIHQILRKMDLDERWPPKGDQ